MGGDPEPYSDPWQVFAWWHPARLLGRDLWRWTHYYDGPQMEYGCSKKVARELLHRTYAPEKERDVMELIRRMY